MFHQEEVVAPFVEGYFRLPAVWVGSEPDISSVRQLNPAIHHQTILRRQIASQIVARVRRDGLFLFDFSKWAKAPTYRMPEFSVADGGTIPSEIDKIQRDAENAATVRAQLMNAHQACLSTAEKRVGRRSSAIGVPVDSATTIKAWNLEQDPRYLIGSPNRQDLAMNYANNAFSLSNYHPGVRLVIEVSVVENSFELLEKIISVDEVDLIGLVDLIYVAAYRYSERRFDEAIVLSWAVCEQLLNVLWERYVSSASGRLNKNRRKTLIDGRDYSASVISEILELGNALPNDLYQEVNNARRARNNWAHKLARHDNQDAFEAVVTSENLLRYIFGIDVQLSFQHGGGVPWAIASKISRI